MRLLALGVAVQAAAAADLTQFHHKARHAAVILDQTLYIDGGERALWAGQGSGILNTSLSNLAADTNTYSVDLSSGWTNSSVSINTIPKNGAPVLQSEALWYHKPDEAFQYDGGLSLATYLSGSTPRPSNALWALSPGGQNRWTQDNQANNFSTLVRVVEGSYASGNSLGFALGGYQTAGTTNNLAGVVWLPGMVMYNMSSNLWYNVSAGGDYAGGSSNAGAHLVTTFGNEGILVALAGNTQTSFLGLDRATMFDPVSQQWRTQRVSGDRPNPVIAPCVTGVAGDNGTYEIFFFGGLQAANNGWVVSDGSVYILSLPAFRWFKLPSDTQGRYYHSCNAIGKGNRQMVVYGGIVVPGPLNSTNFTLVNQGGPDPWAQGLGVFDMTALTWSSQWDATPGRYVTPDVVKQYYQKNGQYPSSWDDPLVQTWFTTRNSVSSGSNGTSPSTSPSSTPSPSHGISGGAIAGIVIGVIAVIAIVLLAVWLLRRRHRQKRAALARPDSVPPEYSAGTHNPAEAHPQGGYYGQHESKHYAAKTSPYPVEAHAIQQQPQQPQEMEGWQLHELGDQRQEPAELDASRK